MSVSECRKCRVQCETTEELLKCCECNGLFHPGCTKIRTMSKFIKLSEQKKTSWKCDECNVESSSTSSSTRDTENLVLEAIKELNKKMDSHYEELKAKMDENSNSLQKLQESVDEVKKEHESLKKECKEIREQTCYVSDECHRLQQEVRELQQYTRRENLEIVGIPVTTGEDVYQIIEQVSKTLKVFYSRSEVSVAHRVPLPARSKSRHPSIIVRFVSRSSRETWLGAARTARPTRLTTKDINPNLPEGHVYINEHLSPYNKLLLSKGKALVKEGKLAFAWAREGKILIKKSKEDRAVRVWDIEDLKV